MSKETVINIASKTLNYLVDGGETPYYVAKFSTTDGRNAIRVLTSQGLIIFREEPPSVSSIADVTVLGEKANKIGLSKYLFEKESREFEKTDLEFQKLKIDVKNSNRVFKTYWYTFVMSVIGFLLSLYLLYLKLRDESKPKPTVTQQSITKKP